MAGNAGASCAADAADRAALRVAIAAAVAARQRGNEPFGAVLAEASGRILLVAENTQVTDRDCTAHAEMNLLRAASRAFDRGTLAAVTLYASCEPCPMCAGAIHWSGIGRVVYALGHQALRRRAGKAPDPDFLACREVLARGHRGVTVIGPLLEDEAAAPHTGYWTGLAAEP